LCSVLAPRLVAVCGKYDGRILAYGDTHRYTEKRAGSQHIRWSHRGPMTRPSALKLLPASNRFRRADVGGRVVRIKPDPATVNELRTLGLIAETDDEVVLFHATSVEGARAIGESGAMKADDSGVIYLSTSREIADVHGSSGRDITAILEVRVAVADLEISKDWRFEGGDRVDLMLLSNPGAMHPVQVVGWESCESLRRTFDEAADLYDIARPVYPHELFEDLIELANLDPGDRLLEIGCATGKATRPLLEHGFSVTCVELGARLAKRARHNLAGLPVEIHVAPFETWQTKQEPFDLVYAATSWHWIDPEIRYRKAHRLLRPGGHLAIWSAQHAFPEGFDPFFTEIQTVYDAIGESHPGEWPPLPPDDASHDAAEIEATGLFGDVRVRRYVWEVTYTTDEYIALLNTFSGHIAMDAAKRERLYGEIRDRIARRTEPQIRRHWQAILQVAERAAT
jgi:SAM-dependent methyltransferase